MNQNELTLVTFDDYIRHCRQKGIRQIIWGEHGWSLLLEVLKAMKYEPCNGVRYFGVNHFQDGTI